MKVFVLKPDSLLHRWPDNFCQKSKLYLQVPNRFIPYLRPSALLYIMYNRPFACQALRIFIKFHIPRYASKLLAKVFSKYVNLGIRKLYFFTFFFLSF
jgi:hypothetical protein